MNLTPFRFTHSSRRDAAMRLLNSASRTVRRASWLVLASCAGQTEDQGRFRDDEVRSASQELVVVGEPPPTRATITSEMPRLYSDRPDEPTGRYTSQADINFPPSSNRSSWVSSVAGDIYKTSAALGAKLDAAFTSAEALRVRRADQWESVMGDLQDFARMINLPQPIINPAQARFFGYTPEHARWLTREQAVNGGVVSFPEPASYGELRQRGARIYCAAKAAFERYGGASRAMGRKTLATISVLGQRVDVLSLEPMVALSAPEKYASASNDGAQAFLIPLTVGTRITPISLLPSLPELRNAVGFVTADSETVTASTPANATHRWWQTVTHVDAFVSSSHTASIDPDPATLFTIGPVAIQYDLYFDIHTHSCSQATGVDKIEQCAEAPHQRVNRLLQGQTGTGGPLERKGRTAGEVGGGLYNDDFWTRSAAGSTGYIGGSTTTPVAFAGANTPSAIRMLQNNDKSLEVRTGVFAELELKAGASGKIGVFFVEVSIGGGLNANADVVHTVREQMGATKRLINNGGDRIPLWLGETSLSVTPSTEASIYADIVGTVLLSVDLPFVGRTPLASVDVDSALRLTSSNSNGWDEEDRLRISTMTSHTVPSSLESHWPAPRNEAATPFIAQPDSIATCLADAAPTGGLAAPCESVPGEYPSTTKTSPPHADLCIKALTQGLDWDRQQPRFACHFALADFVRGGTSKPVPNTFYRTRVLDDTSAASLKSALDICAISLRSQSAIQELVDIQLCTPDATASATPLVVTPRLTGEATLESNVCR